MQYPATEAVQRFHEVAAMPAASTADPVDQQLRDLVAFQDEQHRSAFMLRLSTMFSGDRPLLTIEAVRDKSAAGHLHIIKTLGRVAKEIETWSDARFIDVYKAITLWVGRERAALDAATRHDVNFGGGLL